MFSKPALITIFIAFVWPKHGHLQDAPTGYNITNRASIDVYTLPDPSGSPKLPKLVFYGSWHPLNYINASFWFY